MLASILSYGLAVGAVYALIGITYNVMFSASRVFSFTAGMLGMLGGVLGALFINRLGLPVIVGFVLVAGRGARARRGHRDPRRAAGAEEHRAASLRAVDAGLRADDPAVHRHRVEHRAAAVPAPDSIIGSGLAGPEVLAAGAGLRRRPSSGLELLYRRTLVGRAFLAIAEDNYAARALGLPERGLRMASFALAGMIGALAGFTGGEMLLAFFGNQSILNFYGFVPVALGGMGNNRGAVIGGLALGLFQQAANFLVGGIFAAVAVFAVFIIVLLAAARGPGRRGNGPAGMMDTRSRAVPVRSRRRRADRGAGSRGAIPGRCSSAAACLPLLADAYSA